MVVVVGDEGGGVGARRGEGRPARRGEVRRKTRWAESGGL
jgi:hypothetical protein